jgi:hypothetical protein
VSVLCTLRPISFVGATQSACAPVRAPAAPVQVRSMRQIVQESCKLDDKVSTQFAHRRPYAAIKTRTSRRKTSNVSSVNADSNMHVYSPYTQKPCMPARRHFRPTSANCVVQQQTMRTWQV